MRKNLWPRSPFLRRPEPWTWQRVLRAFLAWIGGLTLFFMGLGLAGALATGALARAWNLKAELLPISVEDRNGAPLGVIDHCVERNVVNAVPCRESLSVPLRDISREFLLAYLAKEDVRFFSHAGVDLGRLPAALLKGSGGSTITQQLLKNSVLAGHFDYDTGRKNPALVLTRKATEWVLAPIVTFKYGRAEVLQMSVNSLPYLGIGQRKGIYDAARIMFGVEPSQLSLAQSAFLVGLLPAPGKYLVSEQTPPDVATARFHWMRQQQLATLQILRSRGLITAQQYGDAVATPIQPRLWQVQYAGAGTDLRVLAASRNPDYRQMPEPAWAVQSLVTRELQKAGLNPRRVGRLVLTLDATAQAALTARVTGEGPTGPRPAGIAEGAAVVEKTGGILALASSTGGNLSAEAGKQWAVTAQRPVASTVKPLLYALAFESGLTQQSRYPDVPTKYLGQPIANNSGTFLGRRVSLREANARSLNTVAVQVGLEREQAFRARLSRAGYHEDPANRASPALGTYRAAPLTVASVYASFSGEGTLCEPYLLAEVYDRNGQPISLSRRSCTPLFTADAARETQDMLRGAVTENYGHVHFLRGPANIGAKSGTTDNVKDSWCAGMTNRYAMSVWIGDPSGLSSVPTEMYRQQTACRELEFLAELPR